MRDWLVSQASEVVAGSPEQLADHVATRIAFWRGFVREHKLKFEP